MTKLRKTNKIVSERKIKTTEDQKTDCRMRLAVVLVSACLLLAATAFSVSAVRAKQHADALWQNVTIALETPLSAEAVKALGDKEQEAAFAAWTELGDQTVRDPDLGRRVRTDVLFVYGSVDLVLPLARGLAENDKASCVLGERTAWKLFGSTHVVGDKICIGDEERTICAVLKMPQDAVIVGGKCGIDIAGYDRITLDSRQVKDGETFLMQKGLSGKVLRFDCLKSPVWLLELIPGKWSDFSGWQKNLEQKVKDFTLLSQIHKTGVELDYENQCRRYLWNTALEVVCIFALVRSAFGLLARLTPSPRYGAFLRAGRSLYHTDAETDPHESRADS